MYGDNTAKTPNLDALAKESMVYQNAFAPVGVCAPTRSSIITGMYPTSIGTMHMRAGKDVHAWGKRVYERNIPINDIEGNPIRQYSTVIPNDIKCFPEYLRAAGYYCTNNKKTDYQFAAPITAWDENSGKAHWRNRPKDSPFFAVFNFGSTHESRLWKNKDLPLTVHSEDVTVPPYLPDTAISRIDVARHYSNIEIMDSEIAVIINQLKEDGLYENTTIFFYSDHGGPLPREKREIYDSGLKVPFMIKHPNASLTGNSNRLISFVDLAPTLLSLANIKPPKHIQGKAFLGAYEKKSRSYVFGSSDRFDEQTDRIRSVRDDRFLYLKNYYPKKSKYKDIGYRKNIAMMQEMLVIKDKKQLTEAQELWFDTKTEDELYDCKTDPHNLVNLATDPIYNTQLARLKKALRKHQKKHIDLAETPEATLIKNMWPNNVQPQTTIPSYTLKNNKVRLKPTTKGASIAYLLVNKPVKKLNYDSKWQLYTKPIPVKKGQIVYYISERIGFKESIITKKTID